MPCHALQSFPVYATHVSSTLFLWVTSSNTGCTACWRAPYELLGQTMLAKIGMPSFCVDSGLACLYVIPDMTSCIESMLFNPWRYDVSWCAAHSSTTTRIANMSKAIPGKHQVSAADKSGSCSPAVFVLSVCCRSVTAWRKWYHGARGQGGPFKAEGAPLVAPTPLRREDILDRYTQHVKSCPSCSKVHGQCQKQPLQFAMLRLLAMYRMTCLEVNTRLYSCWHCR